MDNAHALPRQGRTGRVVPVSQRTICDVDNVRVTKIPDGRCTQGWERGNFIFIMRTFTFMIPLIDKNELCQPMRTFFPLLDFFLMCLSWSKSQGKRI